MCSKRATQCHARMPRQGELSSDGVRHLPQQEPRQSSRRDAIAVFASAAALLSATPAWALLGIGEGQEKLDAYTSDTVSAVKLIAFMLGSCALPVGFSMCSSISDDTL